MVYDTVQFQVVVNMKKKNSITPLYVTMQVTHSLKIFSFLKTSLLIIQFF